MKPPVTPIQYFYPRKGTCDECGREFEQISKEITTCTTCLLHPSDFRKGTAITNVTVDAQKIPVPLYKNLTGMEPVMKKGFVSRKKKKCVCGCGEEFEPTGNRQVYAPGHNPIQKKSHDIELPNTPKSTVVKTEGTKMRPSEGLLSAVAEIAKCFPGIDSITLTMKRDK